MQKHSHIAHLTPNHQATGSTGSRKCFNKACDLSQPHQRLVRDFRLLEVLNLGRRWLVIGWYSAIPFKTMVSQRLDA